MADTIAVAVTRAVRDVELNGVTVGQGQAIGLINDDLKTSGDDDLEVACGRWRKPASTTPSCCTARGPGCRSRRCKSAGRSAGRAVA